MSITPFGKTFCQRLFLSRTYGGEKNVLFTAKVPSPRSKFPPQHVKEKCCCSGGRPRGSGVPDYDASAAKFMLWLALPPPQSSLLKGNEVSFCDSLPWLSRPPGFACVLRGANESDSRRLPGEGRAAGHPIGRRRYGPGGRSLAVLAPRSPSPLRYK